MTDKKLSQLPVGTPVNDADLFYSAQSVDGSYTQVQQSASAFRNYITITGTPRIQRSITDADISAGTFSIISLDQILNCNISTGSPSCTLPLASSRLGAALTFKDVGSRFLAHPLTLTPTAPDTIDGMANYVLANNRAAVTLVPLNDGVNSGWMIA